MNNGNLAKIVTKILFLITHEHSKAPRNATVAVCNSSNALMDEFASSNRIGEHDKRSDVP
jgi:hypothetical protein